MGTRRAKRLRYFLQRDTALQGTMLRIFLSEVERCLREHSPGSSVAARIGAVAFIHRFGSSLNEHIHFHCCVIDWVFEPVVAPDDSPRCAPGRTMVASDKAPAAVPPAPTSAATRDEPRHRAAARYLRAILLARIYEAFPLQCSICHASMRIIAFVNDPAAVSKILDHIGESTQPPRITPARGPPLWEAATAADQAGNDSDQAGNDSQWDSPARPAPEIEFDQRIVW